MENKTSWYKREKIVSRVAWSEGEEREKETQRESESNPDASQPLLFLMRRNWKLS